MEAAKEIIAHGADVNRSENDGWTALHFATDGGFDKIVDELLKAGADKAARTNGGKTAHEIAIDHGFLTIADKTLVVNEL